jgi:cytochrome P450
MDDEWKVHRTAMNKAFHVVDLKGMVTTFASVGARLCDYLAQCASQHTAIDLVPTLKAATIDVVGITGFGYDFHAVDSLLSGKTPFAVHEFQWLQAELVRRTYSMNPLLRFYWLPTAANREHARCRSVVRGLVSNIVAHRMKAAGSSGTHDDLLQHMLEAAKEDKSGLITEASLTDSLMTLVFAGFDTTSLALSFATYLLTQHRDVLVKLREELDREMPRDAAQVTADVVGRLRYTRAVLEESMRLYPPVPSTARTLTQEVTLSNGVSVPPGVQFAISSHAVHRDAHNWPQPGTPALLIVSNVRRLVYVRFDLVRRGVQPRSFLHSPGLPRWPASWRKVSRRCIHSRTFGKAVGASRVDIV